MEMVSTTTSLIMSSVELRCPYLLKMDFMTIMWHCALGIWKKYSTESRHSPSLTKKNQLLSLFANTADDKAPLLMITDFLKKRSVSSIVILLLIAHRVLLVRRITFHLVTSMVLILL